MNEAQWLYSTICLLHIILYTAILESITYVNNVCMQISCLHSDQSVNRVSAYGAADTEQHTLFMFLDLDRCSILAVYGRVRELLEWIKK